MVGRLGTQLRAPPALPPHVPRIFSAWLRSGSDPRPPPRRGLPAPSSPLPLPPPGFPLAAVAPRALSSFPFSLRTLLSPLAGQLYAKISVLPFFGLFPRGEAGPGWGGAGGGRREELLSRGLPEAAEAAPGAGPGVGKCEARGAGLFVFVFPRVGLGERKWRAGWEEGEGQPRRRKLGGSGSPRSPEAERWEAWLLLVGVGAVGTVGPGPGPRGRGCGNVFRAA